MFRRKIIAALFDVNSRGAEIAWTGRLETLPGMFAIHIRELP